MTFSASECFNDVRASCALAGRLRSRFSGITGPYVKVFMGRGWPEGFVSGQSASEPSRCKRAGAGASETKFSKVETNMKQKE